MILILSSLLVFLTFLYLLISIILIIGTVRLKKKTIKGTNLPFVSILVPAKDEEKTIANCLESLLQQKYPSDKYEIVVVNDRSTDNTPSIIKRYQQKHSIIKILNIESNTSGLTGKQNAMIEGLKLCKGKIILNTDADCFATPMWVSKTVAHFSPQMGLVIGFHIPYNTRDSRSVFVDLQSLDMLFLMDSAAGSFGMNVHVGGAGRNLTFHKDINASNIYKQMGFTITEDTALIQYVSKNTNWGISAVYDKDALIMTSAESSLKKFLIQRIRWTLGGHTTRSWILMPLYSIFLYHLYLAVLIPIAFFLESLAIPVLISFVVKTLVDFVRCWRISREFQRLELLKVFMLYEFFMIFYSIISGFGSLFIRKVKWKGDTYVTR